MICSHLPSLLGVVCHPLTDDGSVALVETPFTFDDGDGINVYIERRGSLLRFFDDGETLLHFMGRGLKFDSGHKTRFLSKAGEPFGVVLSEGGDLEIWAPQEHASKSFAAFVSTLLAVTRWEYEQKGVATDVLQLLEEVEMYLRAWKPSAPLIREPEYQGITGHVYKLDFDFDGRPVAAINTHHSTVSSTIRKLLDITNRPENVARPLVILDDRADAKHAKMEALVIQAVADVLVFSALERNAMRGVVSQN